MKCKYCGNENDIGSTFCSSCGKNIKEVEVNNDKIKTEGVNKNKIIFLSSVLTIFIACIMLITMLLVNRNNPKRVFTNFTNKMYKEYNTQVSKKYDTASETLEIIPKIESTDLGEMSTLLNNLKIIINASVDKKNNKMGYNIKTLYKNEDLLNISSIMDKDLYIKFNNLYDKYLKLEETSNTEIDLSNLDNLNIILKKYIDAFNNSLKNSYFKTSTEKVKTNGKEIILYNGSSAHECCCFGTSPSLPWSRRSRKIRNWRQRRRDKACNQPQRQGRRLFPRSRDGQQEENHSLRRGWCHTIGVRPDYRSQHHHPRTNRPIARHHNPLLYGSTRRQLHHPIHPPAPWTGKEHQRRC